MNMMELTIIGYDHRATTRRRSEGSHRQSRTLDSAPRLHPAIEHDLVVLGKSKPHIGSRFFHAISLECSLFETIPLFITSYFVVLNPPVSLIAL